MDPPEGWVGRGGGGGDSFLACLSQLVFDGLGDCPSAP